MNRALCLALLLSTAGCYKTNYSFGSAAGGASNDDMHVGLVFGLVELDENHLNEICPNGVAGAYSEVGVVDGLISMISMNIVTPHTVKIWCKGGAAWDVEVNNDGVVTSVTPDDPKK